MARKGWDLLKPSYRNRLENKGISRKDYETGKPIKAGRGHEHTPERPRLANPKEHSIYLSKREAGRDRLEQRMQEFWSNAPKFNPMQLHANLEKSDKRTAGYIEYLSNLDDEDLFDEITEHPEILEFIGYK